MRALPAVLLCFLLAFPSFARDKEVFFDVPLDKVEVTEGSLPAPGEHEALSWRLRAIAAPRVILDGPGEAWLDRAADASEWHLFELFETHLYIRRPTPGDVTGRVILTGRRDREVRTLRFRIPAASAMAEARDAVLDAGERHFQALVSQGVPGSAWFRQRAWALRVERLGKAAGEISNDPELVRSSRGGDLDETFRLFSGGRAVAENLQLDRLLTPEDDKGEQVPLADIEGITVEEIDWAPLLEGKDPATDSLAHKVPAAQYAVFLPSVRSLVRLVDEARGAGAPVLSWLDTRSTDARTWERTQRQLCVSLSGANRFLAAAGTGAVAVTGSDPFLRTGSDVAVLVETHSRAPFLYLLFKHYLALGAHPDARRSLAVRDGRVIYGVVTPDRRISSYIMPIPGGLLVTNSMVQVNRIVNVLGGEFDALAKTPEYRFFRDRYPLGTDDETAFLVVTDAALRAWAGPRSRILSSRRIRAAGVLAARTAQAVDEGQILSGPAALRSEIYGTLSFQTPIAEFPLETVTRAEADAYARFRDFYQHSWSRYFDPIGARFTISGDRITVDLSVFPLIQGSEYRELIELTAGASMAPDAGDPHGDALVRYGMSIDKSSSLFKQMGGVASSMLPGVEGGAFSWLGDSLVIYADQDPFWEEMAAAPDSGDFFEEHLDRVPVGLRVEVSSVMKVTAFLASFRGFLEQTAPNILSWENRTHGDHVYVRVAPRKMDDLPKDFAVYYAVTGKRLLLTLSEDLLRRALDRTDAASKEHGGAPWLGRQVGMQVDGSTLGLLDRIDGHKQRRQVQAAAWANLPVLNEWRRLFPDRDPVDVHEEIWGISLRCPGGGDYTWSDKWATMESALYGHPASPKAGPGLLRPPLDKVTSANLGVTFELGGLRAIADITLRPTP